MNDIIKADDSSGENKVVLRDKSLTEAITFRQAQAFYNEITGHTEQVKESYTDPVVVSVQNIEQLHNRIVQSYTQYNVHASNYIYSVKYSDRSSERFSSIERFKLHVGDRGEAVDQLDMVYSLLVILPNTSEPQEYEIHIALYSKMAKVERIKKELNVTEEVKHGLEYEQYPTCTVSVEFVDITVANALSSLISKWYRGLPKESINPFTKKVQSIVKFAPSAFSYSFMALASFYAYSFSKENLVSLEELYQLLLYSFVLVFVGFRFGAYIGERAKACSYRIYVASYLNFSEADQTLFSEVKNSFRSQLKRFFLWLLGGLLTGITSGLILEHLLK